MIEAPATSVITIDGQAIEYRLERRGRHTVLILHGGHMSARCRFGEEIFVSAGYSVLVASRPGYGRTAVGAGPSAAEFAVRLASLCRMLGLSEVIVVGISIGARSALTLAAFYPELVRRVILMCPTSFNLWPDSRGRRIAYAVFAPGSSERLGVRCTTCYAQTRPSIFQESLRISPPWTVRWRYTGSVMT
jgi:pimeloyl-ACP methyl ester carboxylesterase